VNLLAAATIPDVAIFVLSAALSLAGAVGILVVKNPVHAALSLVMTLFGIAVAFIELQADFLAAVQIIVYAGAIVVLFLFVIMFLGVDKREDLSVEPIVGQRSTAAVLVLSLMASIIALGFIGHFEVGPQAQTAELTGAAGNVADLGRAVFTTYLFAFEATAGLLVIAVIGAVVLARKPDAPKAAALVEEGGQ
jgi:NADH-quinone oxidoreductase subunit J